MSETPELQGAQTAHLGASWAEDVFAAFDLETTGLDVRTDEIVQVAFVLVMPDGTLHPDSWSTIVNPGRDIPDGAIAVHGITSARAIAEGIPATEAHHMILDRFDSAAAQGIPVVIYNVPFDIGFMHVRAQRLNRTLPSALLIDPLVCDRALDKYRPGSRKLIDMAAHYGCATEQLHDVRFDCIASVAVMRALSTRNDDPQAASRPFDADRDGFAPAEGAATLILEDELHALERGAHIYGEIAGFGVTNDAFHLVQPHSEGHGAIRSMKLAINDAGFTPDDIDYINAHGTSTPMNDKVETLAVKGVFGKNAINVPISSTKSMIGHSLGASGALESIAIIKTIEENIMHPTINQESSDPDCDLDYIPNVAREKQVDTALTNSFGFGGQNASLVIKRYVPLVHPHSHSQYS